MDYNYQKGCKNIKKILINKISYVNLNNAIEDKKNIHYQIVFKGWVSVISVDIREYKKLCSGCSPETVTKIIQAYSSEIITIGKKNENYIFSSLNGDEIILVYVVKDNSDIKSVLETALWINTFKKMLQKTVNNQYQISVDFGIGIALDDNQIIAKYGKKYNAEENEYTVIGKTINEASQLSKKHTEIRVNASFENNIEDKKYFEKGRTFNWIIINFDKYIKNNFS